MQEQVRIEDIILLKKKLTLCAVEAEPTNAGDGIEPDIKPVAEVGEDSRSEKGLPLNSPLASNRLNGFWDMLNELPADDQRGSRYGIG